ncbi:helix-turn-helix domain-containing protein [Empedobacter tilapiae]|uniref:Helix-turn-helix domain-containing protein n=1 Tax=Empedobacter tilapiae TaxID=2491114 RepID=A0A4Z1BKI1_9FLAO|nr:helix-turn-helix domain-containing protein [Empedobacter tilapiae]
MNSPNYKIIYFDIINQKHPEKLDQCIDILNKKKLNSIDIIELNKRIFPKQDTETEKFNQKQRSYSKNDIIYILQFQKKYHLNNSQIASKFKLSRNTIAKWKKMFV